MPRSSAREGTMAFRVRRILRLYRVAVFFLLGLSVLDVVVGGLRAVWEQYDPDDYAARVANCRRRSHDMVIIGGSPVSEGIDPAVLAALTWQGRALDDAFNLGLPGGTTTEFWHAIRHGLVAPPQ